MWQLLMEVLLLLTAAFLLGAIAQKLKQSAIIGYLIAGVIVGPLLFNAEAVRQVAELGVALLLFSIGLEFSFSRLRQLGSIALLGGSLQVIITLMLFAICLIPFVNLSTAIALGAMAALSSTAVVLRVLVDRAAIDSIHGRNALGILLLQDIAVVPLVLLVTILTLERQRRNFPASGKDPGRCVHTCRCFLFIILPPGTTNLDGTGTVCKPRTGGTAGHHHRTRVYMVRSFITAIACPGSIFSRYVTGRVAICHPNSIRYCINPHLVCYFVLHLRGHACQSAMACSTFTLGYYRSIFCFWSKDSNYLWNRSLFQQRADTCAVHWFYLGPNW